MKKCFERITFNLLHTLSLGTLGLMFEQSCVFVSFLCILSESLLFPKYLLSPSLKSRDKY